MNNAFSRWCAIIAMAATAMLATAGITPNGDEISKTAHEMSAWPVQVVLGVVAPGSPRDRAHWAKRWVGDQTGVWTMKNLPATGTNVSRVSTGVEVLAIGTVFDTGTVLRVRGMP